MKSTTPITTRFLGPAFILSCTIIWGTAFLAQKTGCEHYGPFTLTCYRNILAGCFLWLICKLAPRVGFLRALTAAGGETDDAGLAAQDSRPRARRKAELLGGILSGIALFAAMSTQQLGIEHTTPGISAFLTANYILIVPFLAWMIGKGRPGAAVWISVVLALTGSYFISVAGAFGAIGIGELWTLLCALLFAVQIMVVDRFAPNCNVIRFSMIQTFTAAVCAAPLMLLPSEASRLTLEHFRAGWWSLFYVGIMSSGIAYTLQNLGQARTPAALAAILMSFESVVGALSGWLVLDDTLTVRQFLGCALVFTAIILTQVLPAPPARK